MNTKLITTVTIPATTGKKTIAQSKLFTGWLDADFKNWGTDVKGEKRPEEILEVREMEQEATFAQMMSPEAVLTQEQILYFIEHHKDLLQQDGWSTFFPIKANNEVFVASVYFDGGGRLRAYVRRFSDGYVWRAESRHRVVVKQLKSNPSEIDSLNLSRFGLLEKRIERLEKLFNKDLLT